MNYRRDKESGKWRRLSLFVAFAAAVLFVLNGGAVFDSLSGGFSDAFNPVFEGSAAAKNGANKGFGTVFSFKRSLIIENESLKARMTEAEAKALDRDYLLAENLELKALLGRTERDRTVLGSVITKPGQSPYDTLLLDVGRAHGVMQGQTVLAYGSVVIGRIGSVASTTSRVVLFSSSGEEYQGILSGSDVPLRVVGWGGGNFIAELPRGVSVERGTQVFSVGMAPHLLGTIENISNDPRDPFQKLLMRSPVNVTELKWVEVIL